MKKKRLLVGLLTGALAFTLTACGADFKGAVAYAEKSATAFYKDHPVDAEEYPTTQYTVRNIVNSSETVKLTYKENGQTKEKEFTNTNNTRNELFFNVTSISGNKYVNLSINKDTSVHSVTYYVDSNDELKTNDDTNLEHTRYDFFTSGENYYLKVDKSGVTKYCEYTETEYKAVVEKLLKQANKEVDNEFYDIFGIELLIYGDSVMSFKKSGNNAELTMKYTELDVDSSTFAVGTSSIESKIKFSNKKPSKVIAKETYKSATETVKETRNFEIRHDNQQKVIPTLVNATLDNTIKVSNISDIFDFD